MSASSGDELDITFEGTDEEVQYTLADLVDFLDRDDTTRATIAGGQVPARLVRLLVENRSSDINREACRTLLQISVLEPGRRTIVASGGLSTLLPLVSVTEPLEDGEALGLSSYAIAVVANLALEASDQIVKLGGLPAIINVAKSASHTDKQNACRALFSMAIEFSEDLVRAGAIAPLKEALQVTSPRVQRNAAGALANMSRNQSVLNTLVHEGIMPDLLRLVRSTDERVIRQVIRTLHSCAVNPLASKMIVESGILPVIVQLVASDNKEFQKHGSGALCCIAHKHARQVAEAGGIPPLIAACYHHKQALRAVQALSADTDVKLEVVRAGGLAALAKGCKHQEVRLAQVAASAMANLSIGQTKGLVLRDAQAWKAICGAARSGHKELEEQACRAFFGLSCNKTCANQYIRFGILEVLIKHMESGCPSTKQHAAGAVANLCNFKLSRDALLRLDVIRVAARALWTGSDRVRMHASRALRLLGVGDVVLPYHDSEDEQLKADLSTMIGHGEFSDCSFLVGEHNEEIYAHRAILGLQSPVLRKMLGCPPLGVAPAPAPAAAGDDDDDIAMPARPSYDSDDDDDDGDGDAGEGDHRLRLPDLKPSDVNILLHFLYTSSLPAGCDPSALLALGKRFEIPGLLRLLGPLYRRGSHNNMLAAATSGPGAGAGEAKKEEAAAAATAATAGDAKKHTKSAKDAVAAAVTEPGAEDGGSDVGGVATPSSFEPLLTTSWLADVRIRSNDDQVIMAHKVILCARCEYLHAMFDSESNWSESRAEEVPVDVSGDVFRILCRYMYTGKAEMSVGQASSVLEAAARYLQPGQQVAS